MRVCQPAPLRAGSPAAQSRSNLGAARPCPGLSSARCVNRGSSRLTTGGRHVAAAVANAPTQEVLEAYRSLQNGSDVRGVALPDIQGQDVTLSTHRYVLLCVASRGAMCVRVSLCLLPLLLTSLVSWQRVPLGQRLRALARQARKQSHQRVPYLGACLMRLPHLQRPRTSQVALYLALSCR